MNEGSVPVSEEMMSPATHNGNHIALILMVTGMIEHRNRMIATCLDRFEQTTDQLHHEHRSWGLKQHSDDLIRIADRIHELAQDNAYDMRNLMVHLDRQKELGEGSGGTTGRHGQINYIQ
jgi:hypothetical protein